MDGDGQKPAADVAIHGTGFINLSLFLSRGICLCS